MALFGAPTVHEDDRERAVPAALATRDFAEDEAIELRIGITTGEALVTLGARADQGELVAEGRRAEADIQLQKALASYRSVGATRYIREGEALLAATA